MSNVFDIVTVKGDRTRIEFDSEETRDAVLKLLKEWLASEDVSRSTVQSTES